MTPRRSRRGEFSFVIELFTFPIPSPAEQFSMSYDEVRCIGVRLMSGSASGAAFPQIVRSSPGIVQNRPGNIHALNDEAPTGVGARASGIVMESVRFVTTVLEGRGIARCRERSRSPSRTERRSTFTAEFRPKSRGEHALRCTRFRHRLDELCLLESATVTGTGTSRSGNDVR